MHWSKSLVRIEACNEAVTWCASKPSRQKAWDDCSSGVVVPFAARSATAIVCSQTAKCLVLTVLVGGTVAVLK